ncbi:hypothetical protein [Streptomyces sp. NPDC094032]|uniref:hypothetical protein n=1 Tax=Streptomyces sp. NPDC094032 TaxID=3155308 RepID=UPI00332C3FA0
MRGLSVAGRAGFGVVLALVSGVVLSGSRPLGGNALDGGSGGAGYAHARVGQAWWVALPMVQNRSGAAVEVVGVEVLDLPRGLSVQRYAAFDSAETRGVPLLFRDGDPGFTADAYKDYAKRPLRLEPGRPNSVYAAVKVVVTGEVAGDPSECRFTYDRGADRFTQVLPCGFTLRLEKPPEPEPPTVEEL